MDTAVVTARAFSKISRKEMLGVLDLTGYRPKTRTRAKAYAFFFESEKAAAEATHLLRANGIMCLYSEYSDPKKIVLLKQDRKRAVNILSGTTYECREF